MNTQATNRTPNLTHLLGEAYQPVTEEVTVVAPEVTGTLPAELDGRFLQIGGNAIGSHDPAVDHAFAGDAMVHGLRLRGGRAQWYRNRWLRTDRVAQALGETPAPGPRSGLSDNANAGLVSHAGHLLALGDGGVLPVRLNHVLDTVSRIDFDGTLPGGFSAQPVADPLTGELHAIAYDPADETQVTYLTLDAQGRVRRAEPITVKGTPMMHSLSLTERHTVLFDLPVTYNPQAAAAGSRVPYTWDEGHGARLGVLPRDGGDADVLWMDIDPCFVFHPVNAYEAGREIIVDVIRHERAFDRDPLHPSEATPTMWRWTIDHASGTVTEHQLFADAEEFPNIDDRYTGTEHRYTFSTGLDVRQSAALAGPALLRHDLRTMTTDVHTLPAGHQSGDPVFVARSAQAPEGDGWLLSFVHNSDTGHAELHVVDTADFTGEPVAVVHLPVRVPNGLRSAWVAGS